MSRRREVKELRANNLKLRNSRGKIVKQTGYWPAGRTHTVVLKDTAGHVMLRCGRYIGESQTWFELPKSGVLVSHDGEQDALDRSTRTLFFQCKACRDRGSTDEGFVGIALWAAIEAALDQMAVKHGGDDTPRSTAIPLISPDSLSG